MASAEVSAERRVIRKDATGGSSGDQPVAIFDERELLSVVIQSEVSSQAIEEWQNLIMKEESESSNNTLQKDNKIPKVPHMLRRKKSNKKCFKPLVVSIGPYHHGKPELHSVEKFKIPLTRQYVKSCNEPSIGLLYEKVRLVSADVRKCYTKQSTERFDDEDFTKMMFLDGCFILQFVYCIVNDGKRNQLKMKSHDIAFVQRDLFLLENQLPFEVLSVLSGDEGLKMINKFIRDTRTFNPGRDSCVENVKNFFRKHILRKQSYREPSVGGSKPVHLLDLMWRQLIDNVAQPKDSNNNVSSDWYTYRSAQDLKTAGIHFRPSKTHRFTDVKYQNELCRAILRLPPMVIDDSSESLLLNLVAYEMSPNGPNEFGVTSYLCFLDTLIDHSEDVKELRRKGILLNFLGSDQQVADLFNKIASDLVPDPDAYKDVKGDIELHYKNKIKLWITEWVNTHFSSPWTVLACLGAILALALSLIQTYLEVFGKEKS